MQLLQELNEENEVVERRSPPLIESQLLLRRAEQLLDGPLITYWHNGNGEITPEDVEALRALLLDAPHTERLYLCLNSNGGSGQVALRIAHLLRRQCNQFIVLVPIRAASAATMLALAADEIQLAPLAALSPVDTSIQHLLAPKNQDNDQVAVGQVELDRIIALWRKESKNSNPYSELWGHIHPLVIGAVDRANSLSMKLCDELLSFHVQNKKLRHRISNTLTTEYPTHSYPILLPEAKRIGLSAVEMNHKLEMILVQLHSCYTEYGRLIRTDKDQEHHNDDEVVCVVERNGRMVFVRNAADWYYRSEERRWLSVNALCGWFQAELINGEIQENALYIR